MERKVTKIGRSYGITLPLDFLKEQGIEPGEFVKIAGKDGKIEITKSQKVELPEGISPDFFDVLERNTKKHDEALRGLVDR